MCWKLKERTVAINNGGKKDWSAITSKRLSRTLSGPRRCSKCQKMVYLSLSRCKHCDELTHKQCVFHLSQKCKSAFQERPIKTEHSPLLPDSPPGSEESPPDLRPGSAMAGLLKIVHWLSSANKAAAPHPTKSKKVCNEKHYKGRYGLNLKMDDKEARKMFKMMLMQHSRNCHKQYSHQPQYLSQREVYSQILLRQEQKSSSSRSSCVSSPRSDHSSLFLLSPASTPEIKTSSAAAATLRMKRDKMVKQASIKWDRDVCNPANDPGCHFSLCTEYNQRSSPRLHSVSPKPPSWRAKEKKGWSRQPKGPGVLSDVTFGRPPVPLTKAKTLSIESRECKNESLCATWPPAGKTTSLLEEIVDEAEADCIEESDESFHLSDFRSDSQNGEESLREWYIPFRDIEFQERIRHGRHGDIYRGRWYGEVLIYTLSDGRQDMSQFLDEVAQMGMIRHENIVLFMGACIEPERRAVITSMRKGPTLFEYLHLKRHKLPFHSKHNIARQIAQGMGYLHAKSITHKRLNSKNIILECRVKLCIMDHGMADKLMDRCDYGCIPRGHLSYLSPELMSSLHVDPPNIQASSPCTHASDIFAFGSLLYELLCERFAFHDQPPHALIWQVATGKMPPLHNFRFINGLKILIKRCWSKNPKERPPFSEIVHILQENISHHRRHSCSEPDRLHLTGQTSSRTLCT